jgi:hypothetical protein
MKNNLWKLLMAMLFLWVVDDDGGGGDDDDDDDDILDKDLDEPDGKNKKPDDDPEGKNKKQNKEPDDKNKKQNKEPDGKNKEPDDDPDDKNKKQDKDPDGDKKKEINIEKRLKDLEEREASARQKEELIRFAGEMQAKHSGFDINKVTDYLKELDKKIPGRGTSLFTPEGIEMVWLTKFANSGNSGFDASRGSGIGKEESELIEKFKNGTSTYEDELKIFEKYA